MKDLLKNNRKLINNLLVIGLTLFVLTSIISNITEIIKNIMLCQSY